MDIIFLEAGVAAAIIIIIAIGVIIRESEDGDMGIFSEDDDEE